jgi:hypothetical protein
MGTALDYKEAQEDCARRNSAAVDLLTRVAGTPEPTPARMKPPLNGDRMNRMSLYDIH